MTQEEATQKAKEAAIGTPADWTIWLLRATDQTPNGG